MRQPSAWTVVLMQLRTSRGDRLHDPFLSCVQLDTATRQQPGPPPPEQANTVKTELNRRKTANPEQGRRDFSQIPTPQDRVGDVRHVSPVSMRPQARHSDALQTIPQRPHGTLRATVEQQAHRQRHPVTVIGRFAWKNSTRYTQSATGQPLVVDGGIRRSRSAWKRLEPIWIAYGGRAPRSTVEGCPRSASRRQARAPG